MESKTQDRRQQESAVAREPSAGGHSTAGSARSHARRGRTEPALSLPWCAALSPWHLPASEWHGAQDEDDLLLSSRRAQRVQALASAGDAPRSVHLPMGHPGWEFSSLLFLCLYFSGIV